MWEQIYLLINQCWLSLKVLVENYKFILSILRYKSRRTLSSTSRTRMSLLMKSNSSRIALKVWRNLMLRRKRKTFKELRRGNRSFNLNVKKRRKHISRRFLSLMTSTQKKYKTLLINIIQRLKNWELTIKKESIS